MAPMINYTLPAMQLVCNIVMPEALGINAANLTQDLISNKARNEEGFEVEEPTTISDQFLEASTSRTDLATLPDGYVSYPEIGVAYKIHDEEVPWLVALKRCIEEGGGLAVIDSWEKVAILKKHPQLISSPHVGIVRLQGEWINANTGSPVSMVPWADGEPSGTEECVDYADFGLISWSCADRYDFICERPLP